MPFPGENRTGAPSKTAGGKDIQNEVRLTQLEAGRGSVNSAISLNTKGVSEYSLFLTGFAFFLLITLS